MKKCSKCKKNKNLEAFNKDNANPDRLAYYCKVCSSKEVLRFHRTKKGVISKIYHAQKRNSKKRGHAIPEYSKEELIEYMMGRYEFHYLYNRWVYSNYDKMEKPTIDRLNECYGYDFTNIRIVSLRVKP